MKEGVIYCHPHYELILQTSADNPLNASGVGIGLGLGHGPNMAYPPLSPAPTRLAFYNGVGAAQKGRPRKRKIPGDDLQPLTPLPPGMGEYIGQ